MKHGQACEVMRVRTLSLEFGAVARACGWTDWFLGVLWRRWLAWLDCPGALEDWR